VGGSASGGMGEGQGDGEETVRTGKLISPSLGEAIL